MPLFGLIGFPLSHSFSKKYFTEKFQKENIAGCRYELFEIKEASMLPEVVLSNPDLKGLNVTIPHKQAVIPFLDELDPAAAKINAVNVIKIVNGKLKGFNSDYYGFKQSLLDFLSFEYKGMKALVLGAGGASKAVCAALDDLGIAYTLVGRSGNQVIHYDALGEKDILDNKIIINTTPVGMYPKVDDAPGIPYHFLTKDHFLMDLVYNPEETLFMKKGISAGASVKNGLEMLHLQAEKAWEIWNR